MSAAFEILGFNTYDYVENYYFLYNDWLKVFKGKATVDDFRRMYKGVDAVVDTPCFHYWEELHQAFPDAKIILTVRDEDAWLESLRNQNARMNEDYFLWALFLLTPTCWLRHSYYLTISRFSTQITQWPRHSRKLFNEKMLRNMFKGHNDSVIQKAPRDKLLVYKVSEGWEPLCKFLGVEIPDKPFPHKNKGGQAVNELRETNQIMKKIVRDCGLSVLGYSVLLSFVGYKLYKSNAASLAWSYIQ